MPWGWIGAGAVVLLGAAGLGLWWARRSLVQVIIDGDSMAPSLVDGQSILVRRDRSGRVRVGAVVAVAPRWGGDTPVDEAERPDGRLWIIKRVAAAPGDPIPPDLGVLARLAGQPVPPGRVVLLGDNPEHSHDSRQDGLVSLDRLRGIAVGQR